MKRGVSLHIGVDRVHSDNFDHSVNTRLFGCDDDAWVMGGVARWFGYDVGPILLDEDAVFDRVEHEIRHAARELEAGDTFLLTFSGHGAQLSDLDGDDNDFDEGWVLHDFVMVDDYINVLLQLFRPKVRVVIVSDSCFSESIATNLSGLIEIDPDMSRALFTEGPTARRGLPEHVLNQHHGKFKDLYDGLDARFAAEKSTLPEKIQASIAVLSACEDGKFAYERPDNGFFTRSLIEVLYRGGSSRDTPYAGNYARFIAAIRSRTGGQKPQFTPLGDVSNQAFFQGPPFTLER